MCLVYTFLLLDDQLSPTLRAPFMFTIGSGLNLSDKTNNVSLNKLIDALDI